MVLKDDFYVGYGKVLVSFVWFLVFVLILMLMIVVVFVIGWVIIQDDIGNGCWFMFVIIELEGKFFFELYLVLKI